MQYLRDNFTVEFQKQYRSKALEESATYLTIAENLSLEQRELITNIDKVYELSKKFIYYQNENVSSDSISAVIKKFKSDFQIRNFQLMLLDLLLRMTQQTYGIQSVQIDQSYQIKQDLPLLKPDDLLHSRLQSDIYDFVECERNQLKFLDAPDEQTGFLLLWLILKEGIDNTRILSNIVCKRKNVKAIAHHWFYEGKERIWLSATAELFLGAFWHSGAGKPKKCIAEINNTLIKDRIIPATFKVSIASLRSMLRTEYILKTSPSNYAQKKSMMPSASLSKESLYRLIGNKPIKHNSLANQIEQISQRQNRLWLSIVRAPHVKHTHDKDTNLSGGFTTRQQVDIVKHFTDSIKILSRRESNKNYTKVKQQLSLWLKQSDNASKTPFCWLLLSWLYHLIRQGGKRKKRLRPRTIKAYLNAIATPFIEEFSDCHVEMLDGQTWAEKLNLAAEKITSSKRDYILYFADYIVSNNLVKDLCLSDLDISSPNGRVNANIITQNEAENVINVLSKLDNELSELAILCFCFSFYSGLRRGEITGLQYADFNWINSEYVNLHVRPNKFRELKSPQSSRNLPLDVLWPSRELERLKYFLNTSKSKFTKKKSTIFQSKNLLDQAFSLATDAMELVTADSRIRFHHCRHSFANWLYLLLSISDEQLRDYYAFTCHPYFCNSNREKIMKRLALEEFSRKKLWAVSILLGHSSPSVTMSSYLHTSEFIHRLKFANHVPSPRLLRKYWGQKIQIDSYGRLNMYPKSKENQLTVLPKQEQYDEIRQDQQDKNIKEWIESKNVKRDRNYIPISMSKIWSCFVMYSEGFNLNDIANKLSLSKSKVADLLGVDLLTEKLHFARQNDSNHILSMYKNMTRHQYKIIHVLTAKFDDLGTFDEINNRLDLEKISELAGCLVRAKDHLIRSYNYKAIVSLLLLLKLLGLSERHVLFRWYFPSASQFLPSKLTDYREDLGIWLQSARDILFPELNIEVVVPYNFAHLIKDSSNLKVITSDEGRFLSYKKHGTVSVHLLQSRFSPDKNKAITYSPTRRSKAYICFLRLLFILVKCNTQR